MLPYLYILNPSDNGCKICDACRTSRCHRRSRSNCSLLYNSISTVVVSRSLRPCCCVGCVQGIRSVILLVLLLLLSCASALQLKGSDKVETDNTAKVTVKTATTIAAAATTFLSINYRLELEYIFMALT